MRYLLIIFLCVGFTFSVHAQGYVLEKGQDGFGFNLGYSANYNARGYSGSAEYSFFGLADVGLLLGKFKIKEPNYTTPNLGYTALAPYASIYILKQNKKIPFSLSIDGSLQKLVYTYDEMGDADYSGSSKTYGASLYIKLGDKDEIKIQPIFGFHHTTHEYEHEVNGHIDARRRSRSATFSFGLQAIFRVTKSSFVVATPTIGFTSGYPTFVFTASMVVF